jgi:hypothetical protein
LELRERQKIRQKAPLFSITIKHVADLLTHVRFPLIHPAAFVTQIETDELLMTSMALVPIMAETRKYHILGIAGDSIRFKPRKITAR